MILEYILVELKFVKNMLLPGKNIMLLHVVFNLIFYIECINKKLVNMKML